MKEYCFEEEEEVKKKMLNGNSKKSWHSNKSWKHFLLFTFTHFYFIPFAFTLHYVLIKSLFDLEDCVVQILIWLNIKCGINSFWHQFMRLLVLSWSVFHVIYMWGVWFCLHYSKTKSIFGLATTFHSHWVLMAWEISLAFVVFLNLN